MTAAPFASSEKTAHRAGWSPATTRRTVCPTGSRAGHSGFRLAKWNGTSPTIVGAAGLAVALADASGRTAILSDFSRLVIDPNRGEDDPTLVMKLYDGTIIPANRTPTPPRRNGGWRSSIGPTTRPMRGLRRAADDTVIVAVHSFTPV